MEKPFETEIEEASPSSQDHKHWIEAQDVLKGRLITGDDFSWKLPATTSMEERKEEQEEEMLRYVGGVDVSFSKEDPSVACGSLVVLDIQNFQVVYDDYAVVTLRVPYVPGFLAFREAPILLQLLQRMKKNSASTFYPQLHHVDGLTYSGVRQLLEAKENCTKDFISLKGCSGHTWGVAMRSTLDSLKPIFISIGHRISIDTAVTIAKMTCKYRVPEPIRQADIRSREYMRKRQMEMSE
ncbi:Endonuclease V [Morella rubra]|uniref:Endonuclease V n=1 Tax=Morella rubra TaxID=262757 RepID=A0A6A1UVS1_9ROSI|nr:Endonuclease V [Morella rubra]